MIRRFIASIRKGAPCSPGPHGLGLVVAGLLLTLPACSAITSEAPPISDSTMVEVLIELHLTDARAELRYEAIPTVRDSILFKHGLDQQRFLDILDYYAEHPEEYAALYTTVLDRISDERFRQGEGLPLSSTPPPAIINQ